MKPKMVSYVAGDKGGSIETPWMCPGFRDDLSVNTKMSADEYIAYQLRGFLDFLKSWLGNWTGNQVSLVAAEITATAVKSGSTFTFVTEDGLTGQRKSVTVVYSDAKLIHVDRQNVWALRAIREGQTPITNEELMEFLGMLGDSTFGFFKVDTAASNNPERLYIVAAARAAEPQKIRCQPQDDMKGENTGEVGSRRGEDAQKSRRENLFAPRASPPSPLHTVDEVRGVSLQMPET